MKLLVTYKNQRSQLLESILSDNSFQIKNDAITELTKDTKYLIDTYGADIAANAKLIIQKKAELKDRIYFFIDKLNFSKKIVLKLLSL